MDELVRSAIAHWGPRFTTNGVTAADFARITAGIERWDDWCRVWSAEGAAHESLGREALAEGRSRSAGEHLARAAVHHHFAKFVFVADPEQMRAAHARAVSCLTDALPHLDPPGRRLEIAFEGSHLVAVVRVPRGEGPHPVVLMLPGLDSAKEELGSTEQTFLDRGMATVTLDGPGQGEAEYALPLRGDWAPVAEVAWEAIGTQPDLDRDRLAVWGVSLGGYYAPRVAAALGDRVSACVSLAGPFNFGEHWSSLPQLTRDTLRVRSGSVNDEEARRRALELDLSEAAAHLVAPLLIVFGRQDRLIPWEDAVRMRDAVAGPVTLLLLEDGNHGCANVAPQHRPTTADWLAARLLGAPEPHIASYTAGATTDPNADLTTDLTAATKAG
ncbi:alpha/beta hydrolase [Nocardioides sp. zg-1308]|uniref:alpha/beta hydrolase family protein n=1 Tax=Nocardioides sp. zg-1308 TaxID=2736253 RepID=UPI00155449A7|nr:alpha/beta hydrolase [Nocardioides sp. zg-1308]NPD04230.1 alpha/beta hydrolase [Nocardioides sp. zg-1308]